MDSKKSQIAIKIINQKHHQLALKGCEEAVVLTDTFLPVSATASPKPKPTPAKQPPTTRKPSGKCRAAFWLVLHLGDNSQNHFQNLIAN